MLKSKETKKTSKPLLKEKELRLNGKSKKRKREEMR